MRHCATSRKVAGSIQVGSFDVILPTAPWGKRRPVRRDFACRLFRNSGNLNCPVDIKRALNSSAECRGPLVATIPILVRHRVSCCKALVLQLQVWQVHCQTLMETLTPSSKCTTRLSSIIRLPMHLAPRLVGLRACLYIGRACSCDCVFTSDPCCAKCVLGTW